MNLLFRLLAVVLGALSGKKLDILGQSALDLRVLPSDLDLYGHVNNGRYLSLMDLGRIDLLLRTGLGRAARARGWNPVVGSVAIRFQRPLTVFRRFTLKTRILGWDSKWIYIEQIFESGGQVCTRAWVKGLLRGREGSVPTAEAFSLAGGAPAVSPEIPAEVLRSFA